MAFFPHLLGLPALFSTPAQNQEQTLLQSHAARRAPVKGATLPLICAVCIFIPKGSELFTQMAYLDIFVLQT